MEKFKSDSCRVNHNINLVFSKLSNPSGFKKLIEMNADKLPEEAKANMEKVKFNGNSIAISSPMGDIELGIDEKQTVEPTRVAFAALNSPVKFGLTIELTEVDENTTEEVAVLELDIPFFMSKMVAPQLKEGARKFGELLEKLPYDIL